MKNRKKLIGLEVESYRYLGVQINQFIRTDTHHKYIKKSGRTKK